MHKNEIDIFAKCLYDSITNGVSVRYFVQLHFIIRYMIVYRSRAKKAAISFVYSTVVDSCVKWVVRFVSWDISFSNSLFTVSASLNRTCKILIKFIVLRKFLPFIVLSPYLSMCCQLNDIFWWIHFVSALVSFNSRFHKIFFLVHFRKLQKMGTGIELRFSIRKNFQRFNFEMRFVSR